MAMNNDSNSSTTVLYVIVVVVAVLVSSVLAPVVWGAFQSSDDEDEHPSVSVITLRGGTSAANVAAVSEQLRDARTNESVEAVVLRIDSSGGAVTSSEEFYLAVNRTAAEMPVVTYVEGYAASGGYFGIVPSDAIYVKPSSAVGSVGVVASVPAIVEQENDAVTVQVRSGPDKQVLTVDQMRTEVEMLQNGFVDTVVRHRGDRLDLSEEEVSRAAVYRGPNAVQNGMADEVGTFESAIAHAAEEADGIDGESYDVDYRTPVSAAGGVIIAGDGVVDRNGSVVYVEGDNDDSADFVPPVRYYAVWGIPAEATDGYQEVNLNASD